MIKRMIRLRRSKLWEKGIWQESKHGYRLVSYDVGKPPSVVMKVDAKEFNEWGKPEEIQLVFETPQ